MGEYILVVIVWASGSVMTMDSLTFNSRDTCDTAAKSLASLSDGPIRSIKTACVKK